VPADLSQQSNFQWLARLGFLVRGILYIVIALLVIGTGRTEDLTGAIEYLDHGVGKWLMLVLTAGMAGYGFWRLCDAAFGMDSGRHHARAWSRRVAAGVSGAIYTFLAYKSLRIMIGGRANVGDSHQHVAQTLDLPAGALVLAATALVLAGAGVVQLWKSGTCSFLDNLDPAARMPFAKWLGRAGYAARGIVFLTVGFLLARAALHDSAAHAGGLEQALDWLHGPLFLPVAAGLLLFGLYSVVEARFRTIHQPPTEHVKRKVAEKLAG
jgi:hypothetical protein